VIRFVLLLLFAQLAWAAEPSAVTPDGGRYYGPLVNGKFQGKGRAEWDTGVVYEGEFARGLYEGEGRFQSATGDIFEGDFQKGDFTGKGSLKRKDGSHYEGGFKSWRFHGAGRYSDAAGNAWEGTFKDGQLSGKGKYTGRIGVYEGEFRDWMYHGQGTLTYAKPAPDGRKQDSGIWRYGSLEGARDDAKVAANVELALYAQKELLQKALGALQPREPGRINLWLVAVAGDGKQEVFRREVEFVQKEFAQRFGTGGRTVALVNSRNTVTAAPMATVTSLRDTLKAVAARMDREQDILFLFLTSHGSREHEFILSQSGMDLPDLPAKTLGAMLRESGIRWKVVVVSACYSGGFIPPLRDERTLVITAARSDRTSFGCADENDFTYFGRAYFKEALPKAGSFQHAFRQAEILVKEWEAKDAKDAAAAGGKPEKDAESLPQMSIGSDIEPHLRRWWEQALHR